MCVYFWWRLYSWLFVFFPFLAVEGFWFYDCLFILAASVETGWEMILGVWVLHTAMNYSWIGKGKTCAGFMGPVTKLNSTCSCKYDISLKSLILLFLDHLLILISTTGKYLYFYFFIIVRINKIINNTYMLHIKHGTSLSYVKVK